jgi:hypothetical protein
MYVSFMQLLYKYIIICAIYNCSVYVTRMCYDEVCQSYAENRGEIDKHFLNIITILMPLHHASFVPR